MIASTASRAYNPSASSRCDTAGRAGGRDGGWQPAARPSSSGRQCSRRSCVRARSHAFSWAACSRAWVGTTLTPRLGGWPPTAGASGSYRCGARDVWGVGCRRGLGERFLDARGPALPSERGRSERQRCERARGDAVVRAGRAGPRPRNSPDSDPTRRRHRGACPPQVEKAGGLAAAFAFLMVCVSQPHSLRRS